MNRKELVNKTLDDICGNFVPQLQWEGDIDVTYFTYDEQTDLMVTDNGISMKLTLKDEEINWDSLYDFLVDFQDYVRSQLKERFNIDVDFCW